MEILAERKVTTLIEPKLRVRPVDENLVSEALAQGLDPIIARILASRPRPKDDCLQRFIQPKLAHLSSPQSLKDIDRAAARVARAIQNQEIIGLETDHDCDGQTSHAVLHYNLVQRFKLPATRVQTFIGHRLKEGYGLSMSLTERILNATPRPSLVITADNGSCDEPRIALLKAAGIDVIVTDHHELPKEGPPESSYACLNPTRDDCDYPDPYIAGCMVAWLLMAATRTHLIKQNYLSQTEPSLADSLDFVAVGTVADCVSIARSPNNRAVIQYGLKLIDQGLRPCWRAIKAGSNLPISAEDLGFRIGPLLNSDGRLDSALGSVSFLLSDSDEVALKWMEHLQTQNMHRRAIQKKITAEGMLKAQSLYQSGRWSLCIYLEQGHAGVHGIAASRLKDAFGRPTVFLAPKLGQPGILTGSVRGIDGFHVRDALQKVADWQPELLLAFGGHRGAGGLSLALDNLPLFEQAFERAVREQMTQEAQLGPVIWTDGGLAESELTLGLVRLLASLEPYGREFEMPVFEMTARIKEFKEVGDGTHAKVCFQLKGSWVRGIWFNYRNSDEMGVDFAIDSWVRVAFRVKSNYFRGQEGFDLQILHMTADIVDV